MKRLILSLSLLVLSVTLGAAYENIKNGISADLQSEKVNISFISPNTVRVVKYPLSAKVSEPDKTSFSVVATHQDIPVKAVDKGDRITLSANSALTVVLDKKLGTLSFLRDGKVMLKEKGEGRFVPFDDAGVPSYTVAQTFCLDEDEAIYGLGNLENGNLSQRGVRRKLLPGNVEDGIPVIVSVKGYGLFWDNYSPTEFIDTPQGTTFESEVGDMIDYYFMAGKDMKGVVSEMRDLTGQVPMFPLWTYGFWQSRERYKSQDETVGVVKKHRDLGIPIDGIIQDWQYWGNNYLWNAMEFMNPEFPNPQKMMNDIHDLNAHGIISIWSSFGPQTKPYRELSEKGLLFDIATWPQSGIAEQWPPRMDYPSGVKVYDAYSKEARDIYWKNLTRLYDLGWDGWWMDSTEPDHFDVKDSDYDMPTALGSFRKVRNAYPLVTVGGVYDNQRKTSPDKRVFILTRSGYAGQQRYGCNVWTGDVTSSWINLRNQIPALLNFTMTGNPNSNSDLGGFFCSAYNNDGPGSAVKNPLFRELYVRWLQLGVFTPMMRSHGADIKREIYYFGEEGDPVYDAVANAIKLRYKLLPYIYSTSWGVTSDGGSFIMPLSAYYPKEKDLWNCTDKFMFGDNILVAPIIQSHYTPELIPKADENTGWDRNERLDVQASLINNDFLSPYQYSISLPKGDAWWDFDTNRKYKGGAQVSKDVNIKSIPVFVKAGSIIPIGPDVQYATEKPWDDLQIRVYTGADGRFTLYEDEFDNYNYEKGLYSTIDFIWNDKNGTLTISDRSGQFPGMLAHRKFNIVKITEKGETQPQSVDYDGSKKSIKL